MGTSGKKLQSISLILALVGGVLILLGAIVVGLWLTQEQAGGSLVPGQSGNNIQPWRLKEPQQIQFLLLLAQDCALDGNAERAREAVAGWDVDKLSRLLGKMEFQTTDTDILKQLIALRKALGLPASMFAAPSLLQQDSILWSAGLALLFLLGAGAIAFLPSNKSEDDPALAASEASEAQADSAEEETAEEQEKGESEQAAEEENATGTAQQEEQEGQGAGDGTPVPGPGGQDLAQLATSEPGEVGSLFSSIFEDEDDDFEDLALLARGLEDLDIRGVATRAQDILDQLYEVTRRDRSR